MHQRIAALIASFAVTSLVMLVGWNLALTSHFELAPAAPNTAGTIAPPAWQSVDTSPIVTETIASR